MGYLAVVITAGQLKSRFPRLLEKLNNNDVEVLQAASSVVRAAPGEELSRCGETAGALLMVLEGGLRLTIPVEDEEILLGTLGPGQLLGLAAVVDPGPASTTATAVEPSVVLRLEHEALQTLRKQYPRIGAHLLRGISLELADWLRTFEEYIAEREQPHDIREFAQMARRLMGIKEA